MTNKPKCNTSCQYYVPETEHTFGYCFLHMFEDSSIGFRELNQECDIEDCWQYPEFKQ